MPATSGPGVVCSYMFVSPRCKHTRSSAPNSSLISDYDRSPPISREVGHRDLYGYECQAATRNSRRDTSATCHQSNHGSMLGPDNRQSPYHAMVPYDLGGSLSRRILETKYRLPTLRLGYHLVPGWCHVLLIALQYRIFYLVLAFVTKQARTTLARRIEVWCTPFTPLETIRSNAPL